MRVHAGSRSLVVADEVQGTRIALRLLYPTQQPARDERVRPYTLHVAPDAAPVGDALSLGGLARDG